jgi:hypothetical protein
LEKIDLKKNLKHLFSTSSREIRWVDVPSMNFVMVDGSGDPNTALEYREAIEALYSISYTIKFMVKKEQGLDYGVMPLEGLWWTDDMTRFSGTNKDIWKWTSMIMQPEYVSEGLFSRAIEQVEKKKRLKSLKKARFQSFQEGLSAQIMFIGPFSAEGPTIENLHHFITEKGYTFDGINQKHHEIYLSDFRKTAPDRFKSIIRQPAVKKPVK